MSKTCLYNFSYKKNYWIFITPRHYRGHSAIVQPNTNFATVDSRVTVGGCSMEYEYKLLRQFTTTVGRTSCNSSLKKSQSNSLQGHMRRFCSQLGIEQSTSGWKATGYSENGYPVISKTNYCKLENFPCVLFDIDNVGVLEQATYQNRCCVTVVYICSHPKGKPLPHPWLWWPG